MLQHSPIAGSAQHQAMRDHGSQQFEQAGQGAAHLGRRRAHCIGRAYAAPRPRRAGADFPRLGFQPHLRSAGTGFLGVFRLLDHVGLRLGSTGRIACGSATVPRTCKMSVRGLAGVFG